MGTSIDTDSFPVLELPGVLRVSVVDSVEFSKSAASPQKVSPRTLSVFAPENAVRILCRGTKVKIGG